MKDRTKNKEYKGLPGTIPSSSAALTAMRALSSVIFILWKFTPLAPTSLCRKKTHENMFL